ncbi:hypothetical protein K488DRAFT_73740, partial [Vararia minispora EC-137]
MSLESTPEDDGRFTTLLHDMLNTRSADLAMLQNVFASTPNDMFPDLFSLGTQDLMLLSQMPQLGDSRPVHGLNQVSAFGDTANGPSMLDGGSTGDGSGLLEMLKASEQCMTMMLGTMHSQIQGVREVAERAKKSVVIIGDQVGELEQRVPEGGPQRSTGSLGRAARQPDIE